MLNFVEPDRVAVLTSLEQWDSREWDGTVTVRTWNELATELEAARDSIGQLVQALTRPGFGSGIVYTKGFVNFEVPILSSFRDASRWISAVSLMHLRQGQGEEACSTLLAHLALLNALENEPLVISQLVRFSVAEHAFGLTWQALQTNLLSDGCLQRIQTQWQSFDFLRELLSSFKMERAMAMDHFEFLRGSKENREEALQGLTAVSEFMSEEENFSEGSYCVRLVQLPLWRIAYSYHDQMNSLRKWNRAINNGRVAQATSWAAFAELDSGPDPGDPFAIFEMEDFHEYGWYDRLRFLFSANSLFGSRAALIRAFRADTLKELAITAIALERFRTSEGKYPDSLEALVPDYLPRLPKDPMDGKHLRYRLKGNGEFLLYSVGEDGEDQQGDFSLSAPKPRKVLLSDGLDMGWPFPVSVSAISEPPEDEGEEDWEE